MLECRLNYLDRYVDRFVIVESDRTFSGIKKDLNFELHKSRYERYLHKIIYLPYISDGIKFSTNWHFEFSQRDHISKALEQFSSDDIVFVSDVDEIPNPQIFQDVQTFLHQGDSLVARLNQIVLIYNLKTKQENGWMRCYASKVKTVIEQTPSWLRSRDEQRVLHYFSIRPEKEYPQIQTRYFQNAGWHLCYFMDADHVVKKIESFSHNELNTPFFKDKERIQKCISERIDMYERPILSTTIDPSVEFTQEFLSAFGRWIA